MRYFPEPEKVKLFFALIYTSETVYLKTKKNMIKTWGLTDYQSPALAFDYTDYYQEEMGPNLKRRFLSFDKLIHPDKITRAKRFALKQEKKFSQNNKRRINIDPGYLNQAKLVLSTTKDFAHRIYLKHRIFAEVTLIYKNRGFQDLPWTFPDYRTPEYKEIFLQLREIYKKKIEK
jgi:hypothetical protein